MNLKIGYYDVRLDVCLKLKCRLQRGSTISSKMTGFAINLPLTKMVCSFHSHSAHLLKLGAQDVEAFVAACTFIASKGVEKWSDVGGAYLPYEKRPVTLCRRLTNTEQDKWWNAAINLHESSPSLT